MVRGMSCDAWDKFSKTILVRYVLSYLCGILYLDPSESLKRIYSLCGVFLAFQPMPSFAQSIVTDCYGTCYGSGGLEVFYCGGLD